MKARSPKKKDPKPKEVNGKTWANITLAQLHEAGYKIEVDANGLKWIVKI